MTLVQSFFCNGDSGVGALALVVFVGADSGSSSCGGGVADGSGFGFPGCVD